jgi:hypothetical protein
METKHLSRYLCLAVFVVHLCLYFIYINFGTDERQYVYVIGMVAIQLLLFLDLLVTGISFFVRRKMIILVIQCVLIGFSIWTYIQRIT